MKGFGANYYDNAKASSTSFFHQDTDREITPNIVIGDNLFTMEFSTIDDIAKSASTTVKHGDKTAWVCLTAKDITYWFISDTVMGGGYLTALAIAKDGTQEGCKVYKGEVNISIKNTLLLSESIPHLLSYVSENDRNNDKTIEFCNDTKRFGDYTQLNCLQYYINKSNIKGIIITQITTN